MSPNKWSERRSRLLARSKRSPFHTALRIGRDIKDLAIDRTRTDSDAIGIINNVSHPGSLGDAYMFLGARASVADGTVVEAVVWHRSDDWGVPTNRAVSAWARLLSSGIAVERLGRSSLRGYRSIVLLGADAVDGTYGTKRVLAALELLVHARRLGVNASAVSFSLSERVSDRASEALTRAYHEGVALSPRGPDSARRLESIVGCPMNWFPDLGWVGVSEHSLERSHDIADERPRVGLAIGRQYIRQNPDAIPVVTEILRRLVRHGAFLSLLPHDARGSDNDAVMLLSLINRAGVDDSSWSISPCTIEGVGRELSRCNVVVSGRMHLTIAALARGVPVVPLEYADKFGDIRTLGFGGSLSSMVLGDESPRLAVEHIARLADAGDDERARMRMLARGLAREARQHLSGAERTA